MAITYTRISRTAASNATSVAAPSWTPLTGKFYIAIAYARSGSNPPTPTISGNGLSWSTPAVDQLGTSQQRITIWTAYNSGSGTTGATTATYSSSQVGLQIHILEVSGTTTSGVAVQGVGANTGAATTTIAAAMAAFGDPANACFAVLSVATTGIINSTTSLADGFDAHDIVINGTKYSNADALTADNNPSFSWTGSFNATIAAIEVAADTGGGGGGGGTHFAHRVRRRRAA